MLEQTIKNFNINFETASGKNLFSNGDLITGHISFDLTKEVRITSITMKAKGEVLVHWRTGGSKNRRNYSAKERFFKLSDVIMEMSGAVRRTLPPGRHMYPFSCQLPPGNFPTSFRGVNGEIKYSLTVGISRPYHMSKDFETELNIVNNGDTTEPELWAPISGTNKKELGCLWCTSGFISMTASLEKKAFYPGETVKVMCHLSNESNKIATPKVKLHQKQSFHNQGGAKKIVKMQLASLIGEPVGPHASDVYTEFMLTIPSSTPLTILNCSFLKVDYTIQVSFGVSFSHDLVVLCPIIIYDVSLLNRAI